MLDCVIFICLILTGVLDMTTKNQFKILFFIIRYLCLIILFPLSAHAGPEYIWQKNFTESSDYRIQDITTDPDGNIITIGGFSGEVDFGGTTLSAYPTSIVTAKYTRTGELIWVRKAGGGSLESPLSWSKTGTAVTTDHTGAIYITGYIIGRGAPYDVDFDGTILRVSGTMDMFVAKYSAAGALQWVKRAGEPLAGPGEFATTAQGLDIAVNSTGEVVVIGCFSHTIEFDSYTISTATPFRGGMFLVKYNADGSVAWVNQAGGLDLRFDDYTTTMDRTGHIYATGIFRGTIEVAGREISTPSFDVTHAYLAKYRDNGTPVWIKHFPTTDHMTINDITTTASGDVIIAGAFSGEATFGTTVLNSHSFPDLPKADVFVAKLNATGNVLWAKHGGGYNHDDATGLAEDRDGHIFLSGNIRGVPMTSADFDGLSLSVEEGYEEVFLAMYRSDGFLLEVNKLNIQDDYSFSFPNAVITIAHPTNDSLYIATNYTSMISMTGETISAPLSSNVLAKLRVRPDLPSEDACETGVDGIATPCELDAWTHIDWLCSYNIRRHFVNPDIRCPGIFENGFAPRRAEDLWFIERPDMALETTTATDFYRIDIPDPASIHPDVRSREVIVAHPDAPEPLIECGTVQRKDIAIGGRDNDIYVSVTGMLNISVEPQSNASLRRPIGTSDEEIHIYNGSTRVDSIATGSRLSKTILCPRSDPAEVSIGKGLRRVGFSVGERASPRAEIATGGYRINVDYVIKVVRGLPDWVISWADERNVRSVLPLPCAGDGIGGVSGRPDFPFCGRGGIPPAMTLPHPLDPGIDCLADGPGCWDVLTFDWPYDNMPFEMNISVPEGMNVSLVDINQKELASTKNQQHTSKTFSINKLAEGRYFLAVSGKPGSYTVSYTLPVLNQPKIVQSAKLSTAVYITVMVFIILVIAFIFIKFRNRPKY